MSKNKNLLSVVAVALVAVATAGLAWQLSGQDWAASVIKFIPMSGDQSVSAEKQLISDYRMLLSPVNPLPSKSTVRWLMATAKNKKLISNQGETETSGLHGAANSNPLENLHPCQVYMMTMNVYADQPVSYDYQMPRKWFNRQCRNISPFEKSWEAFNSCLDMAKAIEHNSGDADFQNYVESRYKTFCKFDGQEAFDKDFAKFVSAKDSFCSKMSTAEENGEHVPADLKPFAQMDCQ